MIRNLIKVTYDVFSFYPAFLVWFPVNKIWCSFSGPQLDKLMEQLRGELTTNPPLPGAYKPKRGELCAAKFVDGEWYRAKVEKVKGANVVSVLYIDFGNVSTGTCILSELQQYINFLQKLCCEKHSTYAIQ